MADSKIDGLLALAGADAVDADQFIIFDTSTGVTKSMTRLEFLKMLAVGSTTDYILTSTGDGTKPTFQAGKWAMEFVSSIDLSNAATADFKGLAASKYDAYEVILMYVIPATDAVDLYMRTSSDGGSSYDSGASDYRWAFNAVAVGTGFEVDSADAQIKLNPLGAVGSAAGEDGLSGEIKLLGPHLSKKTHAIINISHERSDGFYQTSMGHGIRLSAADVDAVQFLFSSGNLESGTITMYGMRNA